jgi:hypothetical protein
MKISLSITTNASLLPVIDLDPLNNSSGSDNFIGSNDAQWDGFVVRINDDSVVYVFRVSEWYLSSIAGSLIAKRLPSEY